MKEEVEYRNLKCGVASFAANYISGILHPFDVIKTRFQSKFINHQGHDGKERKSNLVPKYQGIYHAFKEIFA